MSNKLFRIEILEPKFSELYQKYESISGLKNPEKDTLLKDEKKRIERITVEEYHTLAQQKWMGIRSILDAIYALIPPFPNQKKLTESTTLSEREIELHNRNLGHKIFLDPNTISNSHRHFFEPLLRHLLETGVVSYENYEYMVITSKPARNFLAGHILIKDKNLFESYHQEVVNLCNFIKIDAIKKFRPLLGKATFSPPSSPSQHSSPPVINNIINNTIHHGSDPTVSDTQQHSSAKTVGLCPTLKWEQISIKFLNGHDVRITYGKDTMDSNYTKMEFEDSKKKTPNTQWRLLKYMADHNKFAGFADVEQIICKDLKSQKKELSEKLKSYFGIKDDPFEYIKSEVGTGYLAKFDLQTDVIKNREYLGSYQ